MVVKGSKGWASSRLHATSFKANDPSEYLTPHEVQGGHLAWRLRLAVKGPVQRVRLCAPPDTDLAV